MNVKFWENFQVIALATGLLVLVMGYSTTLAPGVVTGK